MNIRKVYKNRKSLAITLPQEITALTGIRRGDIVSVTVDQAHQVVIRKLVDTAAAPHKSTGVLVDGK